MMGRLLSIQVGPVRELEVPEHARIDARPRSWTSGIFKEAVSAAVWVSRQGIGGDQQADLENHGGPDNVVLAYDAGHYPHWRELLRRPELGYGSFGENFTVEGFTDDEVCIGDVWRVGEVLLEVTQARQPCFKLARRLEFPEIVRLVIESSWGGWYLRVLREGEVAAGMAIQRVERKHAEWLVSRAVQTMYARKRDTEPARRLAALPELSARWKRELLLLE